MRQHTVTVHHMHGHRVWISQLQERCTELCEYVSSTSQVGINCVNVRDPAWVLDKSLFGYGPHSAMSTSHKSTSCFFMWKAASGVFHFCYSFTSFILQAKEGDRAWERSWRCWRNTSRQCAWLLLHACVINPDWPFPMPNVHALYTCIVSIIYKNR